MLSICIALAKHMLVGCGAHADGIGEAWVTTHPLACGYHEASLALARGYHNASGPLAFASISQVSRRLPESFPIISHLLPRKDSYQ